MTQTEPTTTFKPCLIINYIIYVERDSIGVSRSKNIIFQFVYATHTTSTVIHLL